MNWLRQFFSLLPRPVARATPGQAKPALRNIETALKKFEPALVFTLRFKIPKSSCIFAGFLLRTRIRPLNMNLNLAQCFNQCCNLYMFLKVLCRLLEQGQSGHLDITCIFFNSYWKITRKPWCKYQRREMSTKLKGLQPAD